MSKCLRFVTGTTKQLAKGVPIRIMGARLVHTGATTADIYDEATSSETAAAKRIALATTTTILSDDADLPVDGILFTAGIYVSWNAGEIFLYVKE